MFFKSKETEKRTTVTPIEKRRVYPQDRNAFWGGRFVTCTFVSTRDDSVSVHSRMKAVRRPDQKWNVFRTDDYTRQNPNSIDIREWTNQDQTGDGICFFEAMDQLATFETTEEGMGHSRLNADEEKTLGSSHYKAFARIEGILFDQDGLPHETLAGELMTPGGFDKEEITALKNEYKPPKVTVNLDFKNATNNDDIINALMPVPMTEPGTLDTVTDLLRRRDNMKAFIVSVDKALALWGAGLARPFDEESLPYEYQAREKVGYDYDDNRTRYRTVTKTGYQTYYAATQEALKDCLATLPEKESPDAPITRGLELCRFALALQWNQRALNAVLTGQKTTAGTAETMAGFKTECERALQSLGMPEIDRKRIEVATMQGAREKITSLPSLALEFRQACLNYCRQTEAAARTLTAEASKSAPPKPPAPAA